MKLNAYMEMEVEFEELKEKVKYEGGKFLNNERKDNEIIILRQENSTLKKEIKKSKEDKDIYESKIKSEQETIMKLKKDISSLNKKMEKIEKENINNKITLYELYKNKKKHDRNSFSTYKDNYNLKKSSTTSSSKLKSFIINKIKPKEDNNIKRIDSLDSDTNSFDERKEIND